MEGEYLRKTFGEPYIEYCKVVPRFIPTLTPYSKSNELEPEFDNALGSDG